MAVEYWSLFMYGGNPTICDKSRTLRAAIKKSLACEKVGGGKHWIVKVDRIPDKSWRKG